MMETREMDRLYMKAANNVAAIIADYNLKSLQMSRASALSSFEYMARLAGAKTGIEVIKVRVRIIEINWTYWATTLTTSSTSPARCEVCGWTVQNAKGRSKLRCPLPNSAESAYANHWESIWPSNCLQSSSRGETMRVLNDWPMMP